MKYKNIVVLTGAGISAESGLKTFRDNDGLWEHHQVEDVATPEAFKANPDLVYRFYNQRRQQLLDGSVKPNAAHFALARLEQACEGDFLLVTQNVDNLHQAAGSQRVLPMHGELLKARCTRSGQVHPMTASFNAQDRCPCCHPASALRPHIVWFGEMPLFMDEILAAIARADLFISIGTSGTVYPAAGFVAEASWAGAYTVELNLDASDGLFIEKRQGRATKIVPTFVEELLLPYSQ